MQELIKNATPMMKQYLEIKAQYPTTLVFYRLGDFYELFYEDAKKISKLLDLTLTHRGTNNGVPIPLAGVPFHAVDNYIARLIRMGESCVICEQINTGGKQKTFIRKVSKIITPGTATDDGIMPASQDNLTACVFQSKKGYGFSYLSLNSGVFKTAICQSQKELELYLDKIAPIEIVYSESFKNKELFNDIKSQKPVAEWSFSYDTCYELLCKQFGTSSLFAFDLEGYPEAIIAAGALLAYVKSTQNVSIEHLRAIKLESNQGYVILDKIAKRNLELLTNLKGEYEGSFLSIMDRASTPMGQRLLREMIAQPLRNDELLNNRYDIVESFMKLDDREFSNILDSIGDIQRIVARIGLSSSRPKDFAVLREALKQLPRLKEILVESKHKPLENLSFKIDPLTELNELLTKAIMEVPSTFLRDGGVIAQGYNQQLDELRQLENGASALIGEIEEREKQSTGLNTLKVNFNSVQGFYIEVSKLQSDKVPEHYIRKQTLKNNERYVTAELKALEEKTLGARDEALALEERLFNEILGILQNNLEKLSRLANNLAIIDVLNSFATISLERNYVRPNLVDKNVIKIDDGRHPVIEKISNKPFVANSIELDEKKMLVITGPNMGGKSTYMRQVALIVIMARMGCFVPAKSAVIGNIDRIFTRIGASDDLASGRSTFMVEMEEASSIINNATNQSLVLMDEIGRGTSTYEGCALATAIAEHLCSKVKCFTLFATHYPEIAKLSDKYQSIRNICFKAEEFAGKIVFLYHANEGSQNYSYAIEVGTLAGLPQDIIVKAKSIIKNMEKKPKAKINKQDLEAVQTVEIVKPSLVEERLKALDLNNLTPLEAITSLFDLKNLLNK